VYLVTRLIEQQEAAAKKETGGDPANKSDRAEIEQDGDRDTCGADAAANHRDRGYRRGKAR